MLTNLVFDTRPVVVHAHGSHERKPNWPPIREWFFASAARQLGAAPDLTIITCNNGHPSMGLLERSLDHLGVPYLVAGHGIDPWVNSVHKPPVIVEALSGVTTRYVLYADSRDAIFVDDPRRAVSEYEEHFSCRMLFSADRLNWPAVTEFKRFEDRLPGAAESDFRYLNGGIWMGETEYCRTFFERVRVTPPAEEAPESEQGILKRLLMDTHPDVQFDYRCRIFQNIGFVSTDMFALDGAPLRVEDKTLS
ncbi:MAG: hypothetical protein FJX76_26145 [Armatimonadetes bacterium]|nr:hypothetical protein [Armatimonadota bacterium]